MEHEESAAEHGQLTSAEEDSTVPVLAEEDSPSDETTESSLAKIVVFGKDGTGKSALIVRLLTKRFIHEYDPTSEDVYAHQCKVDGSKTVLKIMDTAGMVERNIHEREEQIRWGDGFLLVFSLTSPESLQELYLIKALIHEFQTKVNKPIVLVANKRDLVHARNVTVSEVLNLAEEWSCPVFETAATEDYALVEEPFFCLCKKIKKTKTVDGNVSSTEFENQFVLTDIKKRYEQVKETIVEDL